MAPTGFIVNLRTSQHQASGLELPPSAKAVQLFQKALPACFYCILIGHAFEAKSSLGTSSFIRYECSRSEP